MAAVAVGTEVEYHSEYGDVPATVVEYVEGREGGDYRIAGFWNTKAKEAGQGDVFSVQAVVGGEPGAFELYPASGAKKPHHHPHHK